MQAHMTWSVYKKTSVYNTKKSFLGQVLISYLLVMIIFQNHLHFFTAGLFLYRICSNWNGWRGVSCITICKAVKYTISITFSVMYVQLQNSDNYSFVQLHLVVMHYKKCTWGEIRTSKKQRKGRVEQRKAGVNNLQSSLFGYFPV